MSRYNQLKEQDILKSIGSDKKRVGHDRFEYESSMLQLSTVSYMLIDNSGYLPISTAH